jgi:hypothetical protein
VDSPEKPITLAGSTQKGIHTEKSILAERLREGEKEVLTGQEEEVQTGKEEMRAKTPALEQTQSSEHYVSSTYKRKGANAAHMRELATTAHMREFAACGR